MYNKRRLSNKEAYKMQDIWPRNKLAQNRGGAKLH